MRRFNAHEHFAMVDAFMQQCAEEDPEKFAEVCAKYPTITSNQNYAIRRREVSVGLLGLQPSHISAEVARRCGFESVYEESDE